MKEKYLIDYSNKYSLQRKLFILILLFHFFLTKKIESPLKTDGLKDFRFILESKDLVEGKFIQEKFTPQGENLIPELTWKNAPEQTKSFAFCIEDPDAPRGNFYHWLLINIPYDEMTINNENIPGREIENSWGIRNYKGPSPPRGKSHRYYFKLYALSVDHINADNIENFFKEVNKYKIDEVSIMVRYQR